MCNRGCSLAMAIITVVLFILLLACPWYFVQVEQTRIASCKVTVFWGWFKGYCQSDCLVDPYCGSGSSFNWRDLPKDADDSKKAMDTSFALSFLASLAAAVVLLIAIVALASGNNSGGLKAVTGIVGGIGLVLLAVAFIFFAAKVSKGTLIFNLGSDKFAEKGDALSYGPVGWVVAVITWPVFLSAVLCGVLAK